MRAACKLIHALLTSLLVSFAWMFAFTLDSYEKLISDITIGTFNLDVHITEIPVVTSEVISRTTIQFHDCNRHCNM